MKGAPFELNIKREATVRRYFGWEWLDMVDAEVGSCRSYVTGSLGTDFNLCIV